jgi:hypothetical protein
MVEPSTVGTSTSGMKETKLPVSHPRSWYAQRSSSVTIIFLKKSVSSEISPSAILVAPWVGEEEAVIVVLFTLESSSLTDGATGVAGSWTVVLDMDQ